MEPCPLSVRLLSGFEARVRGEPMPRVRTRSVEWVLALLVLQHGRAVARSWLAGTLWPASSGDRGLLNLRRNLMELRRALGPEADRLRSPTRDTLLLDLSGATADVLLFDAAIAAGDEESLKRAVSLYRGALLEGCLEEWVVPERQARAEACLQALEKLADAAAERGDWSGALGHLQQAEMLDPVRDSVQRRRMQALTASGDVPAALRGFREYRLQLNAELNVEPDPETTRLFQEIRAGVRRSFLPRPQTPRPIVAHRPDGSHRLVSGRSSCLPKPLTALIGREQEVTEVSECLRTSRLVTVVGGGGVGKTRLALRVAEEVAERFGEGALFVELAPLADPALLPSLVAGALGLREEASPDSQFLMQSLTGWLSTHPVLLVLDNCEHLIEAVAALAQRLLESCPELQILATSRQRLGLTGEIAWRVPSLPAPDPDRLPAEERSALEELLRYPAARLFVERAAMARPGFRPGGRADALAVAQICQRLDGIPLALELAAARMTVLTVGQIASRLDDRFRLLTGGSRTALPRHRTLQALIDWSYHLIAEEERTLLRRLAVFAGGWSLEAAEALGGSLDLLSSLEEQSLVLVEEREAGLRYRMLETVREYAREKLQESGDEGAARRRHGEYYLGLAEGTRDALSRPGQGAALALLETELDNLRAALDWAQSAAPDEHLRLATALSPFWYARGYLTEGRQHLRAALSRVHLLDGCPDLGSPLRAEALLEASRLAVWQFDLPAAQAFGTEGLALFRTLGDERGIARTLFCLGAAAYAMTDYPVARSRFEEAVEICRRRSYRSELQPVLTYLGDVVRSQGDRAHARLLLEESLALARELEDESAIAVALYFLGAHARAEGEDAWASSLLEESLEISRRLGQRQATAAALRNLGHLAHRQQEYARALACYEEALEIWRELRSPSLIAWDLIGYGNAAYEQGAYALARSAYEESREIFRTIDTRLGVACATTNLGRTIHHLGDPMRSRALHREALALYQLIGSAEGIAWSLERLGITTVALDDAPRAARLLGAASVLREQCGAPLTPSDHAELDQAMESLRATLGIMELECAWAEGQRMAVEEVMAEAVSELALPERTGA